MGYTTREEIHSYRIISILKPLFRTDLMGYSKIIQKIGGGEVKNKNFIERGEVKMKTLCERHDSIIECLEELKDYIDITESQTGIYHINELIKDVKEAKEAGERMEDRLMDYRVAIEKLGFERKR